MTRGSALAPDGSSLVPPRLRVAALVALAACSGATPAPAPTMADLRRVFSNQDFTFQLVRTAQGAPAAADVRECLDTARRIADGDVESWYREWFALAERVRGGAEQADAAGRRAEARDGYARASNYYRNAGFFLAEAPEDPRVRETWDRSRDLFRKAAPLFSPPLEAVAIPYQATTMPAYFYPGTGPAPRPTVIVHQGFDGGKEELMPSCLAVQAHGFNCLAFDGPGQGELIHDQGLPFRPDWEAVVTPVVDHLVGRADVDASRLVLVGFSMGGYLAPRAATAEHRLAAVIADGGVYSVFEGVAEHWYVIPDGPRDAAALLAYVQADPDGFDQVAGWVMSQSIGARWSLMHGVYTFGARSPADYFLRMKDMTLDGRVQAIQAPVLVADSERDTTFPKQPEKLFGALPGSGNAFVMFTAAEGADLHCQVGALDVFWARALAWLDGVLKPS